MVSLLLEARIQLKKVKMSKFGGVAAKEPRGTSLI